MNPVVHIRRCWWIHIYLSRSQGVHLEQRAVQQTKPGPIKDSRIIGTALAPMWIYYFPLVYLNAIQLFICLRTIEQ